MGNHCLCKRVAAAGRRWPPLAAAPTPPTLPVRNSVECGGEEVAKVHAGGAAVGSLNVSRQQRPICVGTAAREGLCCPDTSLCATPPRLIDAFSFSAQMKLAPVIERSGCIVCVRARFHHRATQSNFFLFFFRALFC